MNLILLGGNSIENKHWLHDFSAVLHSRFASIYTHDYRHWERGEQFINLDYELDALSKVIPLEQPYTIVAKSAGVLLTVKGITAKVLQPKTCVFMGTPIKWGKAQRFDVDAWFQNYVLPTLFIQQSHDPAMSFSELKQYLLQKEAKNYLLSDIPGDDHVYGDLDSLGNTITNFIKHT